MQQLTPQGRQAIENIAQRHGFSIDAVLSMLQSVMNGNGTMAQFSHPEFGGSGQWMQGGMTMVGDMFNNALKARVDGLCTELSGLLASQPLFVPPPVSPPPASGGYGETSLFVPNAGSGSWWPPELGTPSSSGSQNDIRYAFFPATRRLAIEIHGHVTIYDTMDHQISGVSQQQAGSASLTFTSQYGTVRIADLPVVSASGSASSGATHRTPPLPEAGTPSPPRPSSGGSEIDIFTQIEKLAVLHQQGILSEQEFAAKKAELLQRL